MPNKTIWIFETLSIDAAGKCIGGFSESFQALIQDNYNSVIANNCAGGNCSATSCKPYKSKNKPKTQVASNNCGTNCVKGCGQKQ